MNRIFLLVTTAALLLIAPVLGQVSSKEATYAKTTDHAYSTSLCQEKQVKALYQATDYSSLTLEEQEKLLNAAEAYGRLDALGQPC